MRNIIPKKIREILKKPEELKKLKEAIKKLDENTIETKAELNGKKVIVYEIR